jgi:hypothetical protein
MRRVRRIEVGREIVFRSREVQDEEGRERRWGYGG